MALFSDGSARDIQPWEYQPLGPFLSKNFGSTLAPWVVMMEALAPFRAPLVRPIGDPGPSPEQAGSMLQLTQGGKQAITLPNGETRSFLADGDTLTVRGFCERAGAPAHRPRRVHVHVHGAGRAGEIGSA